MKKIISILLLSAFCYSCNKCQDCYVVEYEADGVTIKNETLMGEYCGSDARNQASEKANSQGITCTNCRVECR